MLQNVKKIVQSYWNKKSATIIIISLFALILQNTVIDIIKLQQVDRRPISEMIAAKLFTIYKNLPHISSNSHNFISLSVYSASISEFEKGLPASINDTDKQTKIRTHLYLPNKVSLFIFSQTVGECINLIELIETPDTTEGSDYKAIVADHKLSILSSYATTASLKGDLIKFKESLESFLDDQATDASRAITYKTLLELNQKFITFFVNIEDPAK